MREAGPLFWEAGLFFDGWRELLAQQAGAVSVGHTGATHVGGSLDHAVGSAPRLDTIVGHSGALTEKVRGELDGHARAEGPIGGVAHGVECDVTVAERDAILRVVEADLLSVHGRRCPSRCECGVVAILVAPPLKDGIGPRSNHRTFLNKPVVISAIG